ncbi:MAG: hypothetical protein E7453_03775 [Ruminococcaceae bacterium]|nr:hypothetical protein [Oscillospiraceae bacterium]
MKKKLLDRRGAAIELAIMMMVFSIFITTMILTTALLQNEHKAKAELGIKQDIFLEQLGEDFVDAVLKGEMNTNWKPEDYDGITIETTPIERHAWVEGETVVPTCEEDGYIPYTCTLCGETKKEYIASKTGHSVAGMNCKSFVTGVCGKCHTEVTVRAEHNWGNWTVTTPSTCNGEGTERRYCTNNDCDGFEEKATPILPHSWNEWETVVEADCDNEGTKKRTCSNSGCEEFETDIIPPHKWSDWNENKAATCTEEGEQTRTCSECKDTENTPIPMLDHAWDNGEETNPPSCTVAGEKTYTCTVCGGTTTKETAENGHSFDENGKCTVCNASSAYVLTVVAVSRDAYKLQVLDSVPETESCDTAVLQIVLVWSETDNAYKITEWSKK